MAVDLNYGIGVEGKNLVLKTLSRVYVKVKDRKYELPFRPEDFRDLIKQYSGNSKSNEDTASIILLNSANDINDLEYPGDGVLILTRDGLFYYTEGGEYTPITVQLIQNDLNFENLTLSGQLIFTGNNIPLVISNSNLIQNLNADLLDGYQATDFAIKSQNQNISGSWIYSGQQTFNTAIGQQRLQDSTGQRIYIDFTTGAIRCNTLSASQISVPEQTSEFSTVTGIGQEVWVGAQVEITESNYVEKPDELEYNNFYIVEFAYNNGELPEASSLDDTAVSWELETFWYNVFFETCDPEEGTYTLRNFNDPNVWNTQNAKFDGTNYSLNDFQNIIDGLRTDIDSSQFTGDYYSATLPDNVPIMSIVPNMIIKDNLGNIARVVSREDTTIDIQFLNENNTLDGDQLITIGTLCRQGGIRFSAKDPSLAILKNVLDENSASVYFGELSKIDNTKSGIGMILSGTYPTNVVANNTLDSLRNYQHTSEINIENPYLKWGDNITIFNEDGSGYLSKGQIRWSSNNDLVIDGSDITNSRINNTGITNSSFQSGNILINTDGSGNIGDKIQFNSTTVTLNSPFGPAGGDLSGDYPNPTIKDGVITSNKLANNAVTTDKIANGAVTEAKLDSAIITRIDNIESDLETVKTDVDAVKTSIEAIETDIKEQLASIDETIQEQIEPLIQDVEDLKTTVSEQGDSILSLSTSLNNLNDTVTSHGQSITNINESITTLTDSIDSVDTDLTALTTRVATLESTVGTLNTLLENRLNGQ